MVLHLRGEELFLLIINSWRGNNTEAVCLEQSATLPVLGLMIRTAVAMLQQRRGFDAPLHA